ncbi:hypothetical protein PV797_16185 [Clostridiaceae bacterium M8S5]|nr:hypothetical protein PV797_16185 [Clostridiaceae bacterium M8S5]
MSYQLVKINDENLSTILDYFTNNFFIGTSKPEALSEGQIRELIIKSNKSYIVFRDKKREGLLLLEKDRFDEDAIFMNIRFNNMALLNDECIEVYNTILTYLNDYDKVKMKIYDFDIEGKKMCEKLKFNIEAILIKHTYKNYAYHDVLIFSKIKNKESGRVDL